MPWKSRAQAAYMHIHHPEIAKRWDEHTPKGKKLPYHVKHKKKEGGAFAGRLARLQTDRKLFLGKQADLEEIYRMYRGYQPRLLPNLALGALLGGLIGSALDEDSAVKGMARGAIVGGTAGAASKLLPSLLLRNRYANTGARLVQELGRIPSPAEIKDVLGKELLTDVGAHNIQSLGTLGGGLGGGALALAATRPREKESADQAWKEKQAFAGAILALLARAAPHLTRWLPGLTKLITPAASGLTHAGAWLGAHPVLNSMAGLGAMGSGMGAATAPKGQRLQGALESGLTWGLMGAMGGLGGAPARAAVSPAAKGSLAAEIGMGGGGYWPSSLPNVG